MASFGEVNSVKILLLGTGESEKWLNLSYLKKFCLWITNMNLEEKQEMIFLVFFVVNDVFTELRL